MNTCGCAGKGFEFCDCPARAAIAQQPAGLAFNAGAALDSAPDGRRGPDPLCAAIRQYGAVCAKHGGIETWASAEDRTAAMRAVLELLARERRGGAAIAQPAEPVTIADVLDALNLFNRPKPNEDDGPWEAEHYIRVDHLPAFINIIAAAWFAHKPQPAAQADAQPVAYRVKLSSAQPRDMQHAYAESRELLAYLGTVEPLYAAAPPARQPAADAQPVAPEFDHSIGEGRFRVEKGAFWWHILIGESTAKVGKFHSKQAAEDVALKLLTAFRDGAYMQWNAAAPPARRPQPLTDEQILECVRSLGLITPMGLTRDRGPYEVTEPTHYLCQLVRAIERAHGIGREGE